MLDHGGRKGAAYPASASGRGGRSRSGRLNLYLGHIRKQTAENIAGLHFLQSGVMLLSLHLHYMSLQENMLIKPKTAAFQIRIDPDLLGRFQDGCAKRYYVASDVVRRFMINQVDQWEKADLKAAQIAPDGSRIASIPSAATILATSHKTAPEPSEKLRLANEKRARKRGK